LVVLTLRLSFVEFMDSLPIVGAPVGFRLQMTPRFRPEPPLESRPDVVIPDLSLAAEVIARAVTNREGRISVSLDVTTRWGEVGQRRNALGQLPHDVVGYLYPFASLRSIELTPTSPKDGVLVVTKPNDALDAVVIVDPAKIIIGATTATSARIRFQLHAAPRSGYRFLAVLRTAGAVVDRRVIAIGNAASDDGSRAAQSGVAAYVDLQPATTYEVELAAEELATRATTTLATGQLRTFAQNPSRWTISFASCHLPTDAASLRPWARAAARESSDLMMLLGDQIYGDGLERMTPRSWSWLEKYVYRYNQLWTYQPMREVLRRTPTIAIFDDHEVRDDWGVASIDEDGFGRPRIAGALSAYGAFQDVLNPPNRASGIYDYGLRVGAVATYALDVRSHRGESSQFGILGAAQLARFRAWARSEQARDADVIILASPVPMAYLPVDRLLDVAGDAAVGAGLLAGALTGGLFFGPPGVIIGGFLGAAGAAIAYDEVTEDIRSPDLQDQWAYERHQAELAAVLDILFGLANDATSNGPGPRPRAVFILAGDVHVGGMHLIHSNRFSGPHDHRGGENNHSRHRFLYQLTSSPVSTMTAEHPVLDRLLGQLGTDIDLAGAELLKEAPDRESDSPIGVERFVLDRAGERHYAAEFLGVLRERNMGRLQIERVRGRTYRFSATVEGRNDSLVTLFELDLDAPRVQPRDLIGQRLSATGTPILLRAHELKSGFGPSTDYLDVEAIVQLDTEPGRFFGLELRGDTNEATNRGMFDQLRDAFNAARPITVEYDRTGPRNGRIIRVVSSTQ
jgi:hypothetical protein